MLILEKLGYGGNTPNIGNKGLGRIQFCGGRMLNHMSIRVTISFKLSLKPL